MTNTHEDRFDRLDSSVAALHETLHALARAIGCDLRDVDAERRFTDDAAEELDERDARARAAPRTAPVRREKDLGMRYNHDAFEVLRLYRDGAGISEIAESITKGDESEVSRMLNYAIRRSMDATEGGSEDA